jgi:NAD(P)-dependent dehydrogenase (short-subunit alcohol dehydrogenase family)
MDRVVVITGSSSGIGLATAVAFARAGDTVVATMRDPSRRAPLEQAASDAGVALEIAAIDVTSDESVARGVDSVMTEHGRVDVVVNSAGLGTSATLEELPIADLQRSLDVNFLGVARTTKAVLPIMRAAGHGHVIALSSMAGVVGQPFNDAYCAAKHALEGLYESLYPVEAGFGVFVCLVEPGPVVTPFHETSDRIDVADPEIAQLKARYRAVVDPAMARGQSPEEVADVVLRVADDPRPSLRHQTSRFAKRLIERKLADLSGDQIVAMTSQWLAPPEPTVADGPPPSDPGPTKP